MICFWVVDWITINTWHNFTSWIMWRNIFFLIISMRMRFLNMADFWVAMLCRACRITLMWRGYPVVTLSGTECRMAGDKMSLLKQHRRCVHCVVCFIFHGSHAAPGMEWGVHTQGWDGCGQWDVLLLPPVRLSLSQSNSLHVEPRGEALQDQDRSFSARIIERVSCATFDLQNSHNEHTVQSER